MRFEPTHKQVFYYEAVQWFKHGDHPSVSPLTKNVMDILRRYARLPDDILSERRWSYGCIIRPENHFPVAYLVTPGDWIITPEGSHLPSPVSPEDFSLRFKPIENPAVSCVPKAVKALLAKEIESFNPKYQFLTMDLDGVWKIHTHEPERFGRTWLPADLDCQGESMPETFILGTLGLRGSGLDWIRTLLLRKEL